MKIRLVLSSFTVLVLVAALALQTARSQTLPEPVIPSESNSPPDLQPLQRRIDQLEAEVHRLQDQSKPGQPATNPADPAKKSDATTSQDKGYVVGSDLSVKPEFRYGLFPWFSTPNNDFTLHIGGWAQLDNVWWDQAEALRAPPGARPGHAQGVASGAAADGIGDLSDGEFFRRIRISLEGNFWENGEYRLTPAFENDQFSTVGLDEFWFGAKDVPVVGSIRVGHVKDPLGLEGDMTSSSRNMTFMERSAYSEAIEVNQNFVTGIWFSDNYLDQRVTWQAAAFRPDNGASSGAFFGDGEAGVQARLTGLPFYENDGRDLLHMAVSGGMRSGTSNNAISPLHTFELRARPELRDDDPASGGPGVVPNTDSNRLIDTGVIAAEDQFLLGVESLWIRGPFSFQAEYGWNFLNNATGVAPVGTTLNPPIVPPQDYVFNGGYVQVAYTLTGENRSYDRRFGTLAREYYGKPGPYSNAWLIRDERGNLCCGTGAWEVAARYSYVNLNDGASLNRIQGGVLNGVTLGLNWYANTNLNVMMDWVGNQRSDLAPGTFPGWTSGVGVEVQFQF